MTAIGIERRGPAVVGRPFYLIMSLVMAAVFVVGFSQTFPGRVGTPPGLPGLTLLHGAVFACWVVLFVAQPSFIARGSVRLHRQVGWAGACLAAVMVVMGVVATVVALARATVPPGFPPSVFLTMNVIGVIVFAGFVASGVLKRRQAQWHKRLMLMATIAILSPGIGRILPMPMFGAAAPLVMFGVNDLFALAGPAVDLAVEKRIHPAYLWSVPIFIVSQLLIGPIAFSPPVAALAHFLQH